MKKEAEDFPNLGKETDVQVQKAQRVSNKMDPKIAPARNIIIKMSKIKASYKQQEKNKLLHTKNFFK